MDCESRPIWKQRSRDIHARFLDIARTNGTLVSYDEISRFLSLAICGESGELANLIKKSWRGDLVDAGEIKDELADIRIYLEHLARHLGVDLDQACNEKIEVVNQRLLSKENARGLLSS